MKTYKEVDGKLEVTDIRIRPRGALVRERERKYKKFLEMKQELDILDEMIALLPEPSIK